jgi:hypothetical protein
MCPSWKHEYELKEKTPEEFKDDDGVKMVDEYAEIDAKEKELKARKEELKKQLIAFAEQKGVDAIFGTEKKVSVKPYLEVTIPEDKAGFIELLKEKGIYEEVSMISYPRLNSLILKKQIDPEVIEKTKTEKDYRISLSKKKAEREE